LAENPTQLNVVHRTRGNIIYRVLVGRARQPHRVSRLGWRSLRAAYDWSRGSGSRLKQGTRKPAIFLYCRRCSLREPLLMPPANILAKCLESRVGVDFAFHVRKRDIQPLTHLILDLSQLTIDLACLFLSLSLFRVLISLLKARVHLGNLASVVPVSILHLKPE